MERRSKDDHSGHRQRLLQKLEQGGLTEHELLEILLFYVFKRRNTNDLAHRLLAEYGSLKALLTESVENLQKIEGIGRQAALFLHTLGKIQSLSFKEPVARKVRLAGYDAKRFVGHVKNQYLGLKTEVLDFYLLDTKGDVYLRRRFKGSKDNVLIEPSQFTKMILENSPSGIIAVHNHPSGVLSPSAKDDEMTKTCQLVCSFHNVLFCDHLILTQEGMYSYYEKGVMAEICQRYSIKKIQEDAQDDKDLYQDEVAQNVVNVFNKDLENFVIERQGDSFVGVIKD